VAASYMATTVALFVSFEVSSIDTFVLVGFLADFWHWALVAVIGMETVVHMAAELVMTVKPRAGADEDAASKPLRTVVTGRGTSIRSNVIVTVRAYGLYSHADGNLSRCWGSSCCEE
jgi:hypothetical protein